jgi:hypothetical protein
MYTMRFLVSAVAAAMLIVIPGAAQAAEWDEGIARKPGNYGPIPLIELGSEYENFAIGPYVAQGELVLRVCRDTRAETNLTVVAAISRVPANPPLELKQWNYGCGDIEGSLFFIKSLTTSFAGLAGIVKPDSSSGWANARLSNGYSGDQVLVNVRTPQKYIVRIPEAKGSGAYKVQFNIYSSKFPLGRKGWLHSDAESARIVPDALKIVVLKSEFEDSRDAKVAAKTISYARCDSSEVTCEGNQNAFDSKDDADWLNADDSSE